MDFVIHFVSRFRQRLNETQGTEDTKQHIIDTLHWTAARPGKDIMRNAVLFAAAFAVMLFASLSPYTTVGGGFYR